MCRVLSVPARREVLLLLLLGLRGVGMRGLLAAMHGEERVILGRVMLLLVVLLVLVLMRDGVMLILVLVRVRVLIKLLFMSMRPSHTGAPTSNTRDVAPVEHRRGRRGRGRKRVRQHHLTCLGARNNNPKIQSDPIRNR